MLTAQWNTGWLVGIWVFEPWLSEPPWLSGVRALISGNTPEDEERARERAIYNARYGQGDCPVCGGATLLITCLFGDHDACGNCYWCADQQCREATERGV